MKSQSKIREIKRKARHYRIRRKLVGTPQRPRLCVHRSLGNIYVQVVDDVSQKVLFGMSTLNKDVRGKIKAGGNVEAAKVLGGAVAALAQKKGIKEVAFDRGGYLYHGRIKALADGAREGGLVF
ncbi:MAG: 50S ribosomal protein L18 [Candidatus Omnitrophota bacterium]|nr:50S ribosomal protein L18 [Candidatus Omnitrophota bacterium]MDZ4242908.1 50S ribosomal protein L18 [Candidatus Omnitrophota bacterium]